MTEIERHSLDTFTRCPRKWYYRYELGLEPKDQPDYIIIGDVFHAGMAEFLKHFTESRELASFYDFKRGVDEYTTYPVTPEIKTLVEDMFWYWMGQDSFREFVEEIDTIISIERTYYLKVDKYLIPATPDIIYRTKDGTLVVRDHKTVGNIKDNLAFIPMDSQLRRYAALALQEFGETARIEYSMHRRELPPNYVDVNGQRPYSLTPTGRPSTRTTKVDDYIRLEKILFTPKQLEASKDELRNQLLDLESAQDSKRFSRRYIKGGNYGCSGCPYFAPCTREYDGNKLDGITLATLFKKELA